MQGTKTAKLSASLEDYLEAIYQISQEKQAAKARDISARLEVSKSSVTGALRALSRKGLVNYSPYDLITLTPEGKSVAEKVVRRHQVFRDFLITVLGVDEETAEESACRVEHALSGEILERLSKLTRFIERMPDGGRDFLKDFHAGL